MKVFSKRLICVGVASVVGMGALTTRVMAQDSGLDNLLEEIVVTARKRSESLNEVPLAITAFSAADIKEAGMLDIRDIANLTPGMTYGSELGRTSERPTIRGMSNTSTSIEQPVAVFIDGVYQTGSVLGTSLSSLERVEVVKGPQSALYGRATFGGAINYITKRPGNEIEGDVSVSLGDDGYESLTLGASGAIIDDVLMIRLGFDRNEFDGQYEDPFNGYKFGAESGDSYSLGLVYVPTENMEVRFNYSHEEIDDSLFAAKTNPSWSANSCNLGGSYTTWCGPILGGHDGDISADVDFLGEFAGVERTTDKWDVAIDYELANGMAISSITAGNETEEASAYDQSYNAEVVDGAPSYFGWNTAGFGDSEFFSQEIRLSSNVENALTWMTGLYYYTEEARGVSNSVFAPGTIVKPDLGDYDEQSGKAVFAQMAYDFTNKVAASAELRRVEESFDSKLGAPYEKTWNETTWRVTLDYKVTDDMMIYGLVATGFKTGGFNTSSTIADLAPEYIAYEPDEVTTYELGIKSTWQGGRLQANAAYYFNDWKNQQLSTGVLVPGGTPTSAIINVGNTEISGLELDVSWLPMEGLELRLAYSYIDAEIKSGTDERWQVRVYGDADLSGFEPPYIADNEYSFSASYAGELGDTGLEWFARADYSYMDGDRYLQVQNTMELDEKVRLNARVGVQNENWNITLWGRNLTDDDTATSGIRYIDPATFFPAVPVSFMPKLKQVGVTVNYQF